MPPANGHRRNGKPRTDPVSEAADITSKTLSLTESALAARRDLTQKFLDEIEKEIQRAVEMLRLLGAPWKHGPESLQYEFMRISLDKALYARKKERRDQVLRSWKDLQALEERRLQLLKELSALGGD